MEFQEQLGGGGGHGMLLFGFLACAGHRRSLRRPGCDRIESSAGPCRDTAFIFSAAVKAATKKRIVPTSYM